METIIQYFIQTLRDMAENPEPGANPFMIAGFIASPDDSTADRRALALAIEAWALAYAAKTFGTMDQETIRGYLLRGVRR